MSAVHRTLIETTPAGRRFVQKFAKQTGLTKYRAAGLLIQRGFEAATQSTAPSSKNSERPSPVVEVVSEVPTPMGASPSTLTPIVQPPSCPAKAESSVSSPLVDGASATVREA